MSDATHPDDATTQVTTTEPSAAQPLPTLQLNPVKTSPPQAPTASGPPIGADESLYAGRIDPGLTPYVDLAVADLADQLGADPAKIETISAVLVTWSDAGLGCPAPGMEYAQVPQDGSVIELGYADKVYSYHSGGSRTPFLCNQPLTTPPLSGDAASG